MLRLMTVFATAFMSLTLATRAPAAITVNYVQTLAEVYVDGSWSFVDLPQHTEPFGDTAIQENDGYSSSSQSLIQDTGFQALFTHLRAAAAVGPNDGLTGHVSVEFSTDTDISYTVSGSFTSTSGLFTRLVSYLYDQGTVDAPIVPGALVFISDQGYADENVGPVTLTVGGEASNVPNYGDRFPAPPASLNGTLLAGHTYYWYAKVESQWAPDADAPDAFGSVSLQFGAVPEPATLSIWGLGVFGCVIAAHRRRQRRT